ncbi:MAG: TIGR03986 family CRISPR-associated RAMP protein [Deltaproteobacteria bacterium]|nr:TIGR03986 family CRISPR-associated RAMP protein [Deltaproteobacteria bacterium]
MDKVRAPYNFVPLDPEVVEVGELVDAQDSPFEDGICGTLEYELRAHTPVFVRGSNHERPDQPFALPDGSYAIPGSSLRGMLRNVVEIATFSRFSRFNKHTLSIRDLTPAAARIYGREMSEIARDMRGKNTVMPVVSAGWLRPVQRETNRDHDEGVERDEDIVAKIEVCDFAKIEYALLQGLATARGIQRFSPGRKQSAVDKYRAWEGKSLEVRGSCYRIRHGETSIETKVPLLSEYGEVRELSEQGTITGHLVFTGQPSEWNPAERGVRRGGNAKHHDFVFYRRDAQRKPLVIGVTRRQLRQFEQAHANRGQQGRLDDNPNAEWSFWRDVLRGGAGPLGHPQHAVPVFFLPKRDNPSELRAFGLAMMFRLAYDHDIEHSVTTSQPFAVDPSVLDLTCAIFGRVERGADEDPKKRTDARRGRVSIGLARLIGEPKLEPLEPPVRAVLGVPRATYYPNYFEQGEVPSAKRAPDGYRTLMSDRTRVRGWKRYVPRKRAVTQPPLPPKSMGRAGSSSVHNDDVASTFCPIAAGAVFHGKIRVHNLRPWELGALLWALDFGGEKESFHLLGLAKPLGYGRMTLTVKKHALDRNDGGELDPTACVKAFEDKLDAHFGGPGRWRNSEPIRQLLALSKMATKPEDARHMELQHPDFRNEFVEAKKAGMALAPATPFEAQAWRLRLATKLEKARRVLEGTTAHGPIAQDSKSTPHAPVAAVNHVVPLRSTCERYARQLQNWGEVTQAFATAVGHGVSRSALEEAFALAQQGSRDEWRRWRVGPGGLERIPEQELALEWTAGFAWVEGKREFCFVSELAGPKERPAREKYQRGKMPLVEEEPALSDALERATRPIPQSVSVVFDGKRIRRVRAR